MDRFFLFSECGPVVFQAHLDAILLLANPHEKFSAHITLAGPFTNAEPLKKLTKFMEFDSTVSVMGVGEFQNKFQNTIYLPVESEVFKGRWNKKDYGYKPHITLYDGANRALASQLKKVLRTVRFFCQLRVLNLRVVGSSRGQNDIRVWFGSGPEILRQLFQEDVDKRFLVDLALEARLSKSHLLAENALKIARNSVR